MKISAGPAAPGGVALMALLFTLSGLLAEDGLALQVLGISGLPSPRVDGH